MTQTTPYNRDSHTSRPLVHTDTLSSLTDYLSCLQVVLVNTTLPANIGSAARAMHTMGLSRLTVIDPKLPIDDSSESCAAGGIEVLHQAQIATSLPEALSSCQLVFAASSRSRHVPRPVVTPQQAAAMMIRFIDQQHALTPQANAVNSTTGASAATPVNIAILFGREDRGLTNEELALADYHIQIPANPAYPVLNVAAAVQVIASFIYAEVDAHITSQANYHPRSTEPRPTLATTRLSAQDIANGITEHSDLDRAHQMTITLRQEWDEPAATQAQTQQLTERLIQLMIQLKLADPEHLRALPQRLSRLISRLQLDQKEYQLISAIMAKLMQR